MERNAISLIWDYAYTDKSKMAKRVYNWLNKDNLGGVIIDEQSGHFWFELHGNSVIPNYIYHFIVKFYEKSGYKYLYKDLMTK
jgi:hypothetical protein